MFAANLRWVMCCCAGMAVPFGILIENAGAFYKNENKSTKRGLPR
jgi:hypothetical protein